VRTKLCHYCSNNNIFLSSPANVCNFSAAHSTKVECNSTKLYIPDAGDFYGVAQHFGVPNKHKHPVIMAGPRLHYINGIEAGLGRQHRRRRYEWMWLRLWAPEAEVLASLRLILLGKVVAHNNMLIFRLLIWPFEPRVHFSPTESLISQTPRPVYIFFPVRFFRRFTVRSLNVIATKYV